MAYNMGGRRFRPVGSGKKRTAPQYGPVGTGCPFVEEAVARINELSAEQLYEDLTARLPVRETRFYVAKVRRMKGQYAELR